MPYQRVAHYGQRPREAHYPEACGQLRLSLALGVKPLIDEAQREQQLTGRAKQQQPQRDSIVVEETVGKLGSVASAPPLPRTEGR